jgi:hypothetical protein
MGKQTTDSTLIGGALGNTVLMRVGKANGLKVGQVRALLAVSALRALGLLVSAQLVEDRSRLGMRVGRAVVYRMIEAGYLVRGSVGQGKKKRLTLELTASGLSVVSEYERAQRAAIRGFLGV